jgi:hypothetical protein
MQEGASVIEGAVFETAEAMTVASTVRIRRLRSGRMQLLGLRMMKEKEPG